MPDARLERTREAYKKVGQREDLRYLLYEILDFLDNYVDVDDGRPNEAGRLYTQVSEELERL